MIRWPFDPDRWPFMAGLMGPVCLMVIARIALVPSGPVAADATVLEPLPQISALGARSRVSADQQQAAAYARELVELPFGTSPMYYPIKYDNGASSLVAAPLPEQATEKFGLVLPEFAVTSVMSGSRGSLAMVDGAWRRVGDEVRPGWVLGQIDGRSGTVRFLGSGGREVEVRVQSEHPN